MRLRNCAGALAGALVIASCLAGGGEAADPEPRAAAPPAIDQRNPAMTEAATFALG